MTMLDNKTCQLARLSKDARFDGKFFTAVLTTGIFCRPICPARTPKEENVRYYSTAAQAQEAGYQPCKRCMPELAPTYSLTADIQKLTSALVDENLPLKALAKKFSLSDRQIRRIFSNEVGLPPSKYLHHQRLLKARKLLTGTNLPISDVGYSAGFNSTRRFNEAIKATYQETPRQIRQRASKSVQTSEVSVLLNYRPPFDFQGMLSFFKLRQLPGIEHVTENIYQRSITLDNTSGWIDVSQICGKNALKLTVSLDNLALLDKVIHQVRSIFDLDADMSVIQGHLSKDPLLAKVINENQGIRLPGCWDMFEFSIRAILGQQVSVKAATTLAGRIADQYGAKLATNHAHLNLCFPTVKQLINADFKQIGLTQSRIDTLKRWIAFYSAHPTIFDDYQSLDDLEKQLTALKGIGPWTVNYLAMRGLSAPNAFPASDLGIIKALSSDTVSEDNKKISTKQILARAQSWQPWRAYAAIYLWLSLK